EEPDVRHGRGQLDVAHAFPTHLGAGDLHAAAVAHDAAVAHPLVLAAVALPVLRRTENPLAEQTVPLGLEGAVVDGFRLFDLTAGPGPNLLGRGEPDAYPVEVVHIQHANAPLAVLVVVGFVVDAAIVRSEEH